MSKQSKCVPHYYDSACFDTAPRLCQHPGPWDQSVRIGGGDEAGVTWMLVGSRLASAAAAALASAAQQRSAHRHGCGAGEDGEFARMHTC